MILYGDRVQVLRGFLLFVFQRTTAILLLVLSLTSIAFSQPEQDDQAAAETGIEFQPRVGEYHYDILFGGKKFGTGIITISRENGVWVLKAKSGTVGFVDKIYRLRYTGETRITTEEFEPVTAVAVEESKKRTKIQKMEYGAADDSNRIKVVETRFKTDKRDEVSIRAYELSADTRLIDIYSTIFLARSFDWQVGEQQTFSAIVGSSQYRVTMTCIGKTEIEFDKEAIPVWVIKPIAQKESGTNDSDAKDNEMLVYLSADESKDIISLKVKLGFGSAKLSLVKYLENNS